MAALKSRIVLIYDKNYGRFSDKSDTISSLWRDQGLVFVRYKNFNREYSYRPQYVFALTLRESIDPKIHDIYIDGEQVSDITGIGSYGSHYGIIRKGHAPEYLAASRESRFWRISRSWRSILRMRSRMVKSRSNGSRS
jgi:hypothetical protein